MWDLLLTDCRLLSMAEGPTAAIPVEAGALAILGSRIAWLGPVAALPALPARETMALQGALLTPGLIDCHTHLVFAGNRAAEFEQRLAGVSYAAIARAGGGILATVRATRAADDAALFDLARERLDRLQAEGVTTVEIKSGYGLDLPSELRMLRVARRLGQRPEVDVVTSFLGAHAIPPEYRHDRAAYVELVAGPMLDAVVADGLADAVDAFCESVAFSVLETQRVFAAAARHGLPVKLHADQLEDTGGAVLAAGCGALSADHLEYASAAGIAAMAAAGTVAVLLPGACHVLRAERLPPVQAMRAAGLTMAVATDANPGSSPLLSPLLAIHLATLLLGLTPLEALYGMTAGGARALGLTDRGVLAVGARADLAAWRIEQPAELAYWLGAAPLALLVKDGRIVRRPAAPWRSPG